ncbi:flagellar protein FlaG [candidate division KSB1 bacterium]|nr:flagellar protein FlaG [candidate division KSB1 bacterium]
MSEVSSVGQVAAEYNPYIGSVVTEESNIAHSQEQAQKKIFAEKIDDGNVDKNAVKLQTEELNQVVDLFNHELRFEIDDRLGKVIVKIIDKETGETIRQIPPEDMLNIMARIDEVLGMMFDERA